MLVKVVELYFCERCGQSFPEASLLSQHECLLLPPPEHLQLPEVLPAPTSKGQNESEGSEPPLAGVSEGSALQCLLCPICQEAFAQPGELKEHFKTHRGPQGALPCPEKGCCFATEDRKQLRSHLRLLHGASPVSCTYRACPLLFPSRPAMEQHHRTHFPFHCGHCDFVTANAKLFWQHRKGHVAETSVMSSIPSSAPLKQLCILPSGIAEFGGDPSWVRSLSVLQGLGLESKVWGVRAKLCCWRAGEPSGPVAQCPRVPGSFFMCVWVRGDV